MSRWKGCEDRTPKSLIPLLMNSITTQLQRFPAGNTACSVGGIILSGEHTGVSHDSHINFGASHCNESMFSISTYAFDGSKDCSVALCEVG